MRRPDGFRFGSSDIITTKLAKVNLTEAQRQDAISYEPGQVIQFDRRAKGGFKVDEQWRVERVESSTDETFVSVQLPADGKLKLLPLNQAQTFNVYSLEQMPLAAGDVVRVTKNGHGFRNNELATVKTICDEP